VQFKRGIVGCALISVLGVISYAQTADQTKWVFDVVSLKPTGPDVHMIGSPQGTPENLRAFAVTARDLICYAYDLRCVMVMSGSSDPRYSYAAHPPNLVGDTGWIGTDQYDLAAKADPSVLEAWKKLPSGEQQQRLREMVRAMLVDRFHLKAHIEKRSLAAFALLVAKGGAKVTPTPPTQPKDHDQRPWDLDLGLIAGHGQTMDSLAQMLWTKREIGSKQIVDRTGLTGKYDFALKWTPEGDPENASGVSLFTAIQEQLGLKLKPVKAPMDVVIADSIEKPTAN
jgi:uncharacterized protein (TIGR03435 family)